MKKALIGALCLLVGLGLGTGVSWLVLRGGSDEPEFAVPADLTLLEADGVPVDVETLASQPEQTGLLNLAAYTVGLLRAGDYEGLATVIHPEFGLIFSPYGTVSVSENLCFTAAEVAQFPEDDNSYLWGQYDGIGDPISLTPEDYIARFVWDMDYALAPVVSLNHIVETGNALENVEEAFPDAQFVEFHYPGSDERHDWRTLRLVYEEYGDTYALTAIIHSEWTI